MSLTYSKQLRKLMRKQRIERAKYQVVELVKAIAMTAVLLLILAVWLTLG